MQPAPATSDSLKNRGVFGGLAVDVGFMAEFEFNACRVDEEVVLSEFEDLQSLQLSEMVCQGLDRDCYVRPLSEAFVVASKTASQVNGFVTKSSEDINHCQHFLVEFVQPQSACADLNHARSLTPGCL
jgi:hypothetical protein